MSKVPGLGSMIGALLLSAVLLWHKGGCQDVTVRVIQPTSQDRLCSNQTVVYECQISDPSFFVIWQHPTVTMNLLEFGVSSSVDVPISTADGKFTATLTEMIVDGIRANFTSTLTILPPLSSLNGTELTCQGSTTLPVENSTIILLSGSPDSPRNLNQNVSANTESSVMVQWDPPNYTGGEGISIMKYEVTADDQAMLVSSEGSGMTGNDMLNFTISGLAYNTAYDVSVTAINSCDLESEPATITVNIEARAPLRPNITDPVLHCDIPLVNSDGRPVELQWMYNSTEEESVVYPVRERVSGKLNPEGIPEGIPCPALTTGATSCTVKIPENEDYVFNLTVGNAVGNTSVQATFNLFATEVNDTLFDIGMARYISVTLNEFCRLADYFVVVFFGTFDSDGVTCNYEADMNVTQAIDPNQKVDFNVPDGLDSNCYELLLNGDVIRVDVVGDEDVFQIYVIIIIVIVIVVVVVLQILLNFAICYLIWKEKAKRKALGEDGFSTSAIIIIVMSMFLLPLAIIFLCVLIWKLKNRKRNDDQEMKTLRSSPGPSPVVKEPAGGDQGPMYQDPNTITHTAHPETGELYADIHLDKSKSKKKGKKTEEEAAGAMYQDPSSIQHQQAESGDVYAMPQAKKSKKGKKREESVSEEEKAAMYSMPDRKGQKAKSEGLVYADLAISSSSQQPLPSQGSQYADIRHQD